MGIKEYIANPNCSTIQMVTALEPIREKFGLKRIIVSTYQAVSGAGAEAIEELENQSNQFEIVQEIEAKLITYRCRRSVSIQSHLMQFHKSMHSILQDIRLKNLK